MPNSTVRVVGSGFTVFEYNANPIALLQNVQDSGQRPQSEGGQGYQAITALGDYVPREIVTGRVLGAGTLTCSITELWDYPVWWNLGGAGAAIRNAGDIVDVWQALAEDPTRVQCRMVIKSPTGRHRVKTYHNCTIVDIDDSETVSIGGLSVAKNILIAYTYKRKSTIAGRAPSRGADNYITSYTGDLAAANP